MGWEAAMWLMDHCAPASFVGPAPFTPDGPDNEVHSFEDVDYDLHLTDWIGRVETGDMDVVEAAWIS